MIQRLINGAPAGYPVIRPGHEDYAKWDAILRERERAEQGQASEQDHGPTP